MASVKTYVDGAFLLGQKTKGQGFNSVNNHLRFDGQSKIIDADIVQCWVQHGENWIDCEDKISLFNTK